MWFVKAKRAQTSDDDETWVAGGVVSTLNSFDCGDTRATVIILMREREGKSGGGKGFLLSDDKAFTLATNNFHTVFILDGTRVGDVRVYEDSVMQTVIQRWGTGGGNVPAIAFHRKQNPISGDVSPALGTTTEGMGVAIFPIDDAREVEKHQNGTGIGNDGAPAYTLDRLQAPAIATSQVVRRLTPTECERLQGFPDGWTEGQADSHRYKQMGNAVAVPVVQWVIDRMTK